MTTVPMTREGLDKLELERAELEARRPKIMLQIKEAREKGDLSENAEYHAAREDLSMLEGRIRELRDKISRALIVDPDKIGGDRIVFGATVRLLSLADNGEEEYALVGEGENDPLNGRILTTSPMGQALLTGTVSTTTDYEKPLPSFRRKVAGQEEHARRDVRAAGIGRPSPAQPVQLQAAGNVHPPFGRVSARADQPALR